MTKPTTAPSLADDIAARLVPSTEQIAGAVALMATLPDYTSVTVPIILPGKHRPVWVDGQRVEYVPGLFPATDSPESYSRARDGASAAAEHRLRDMFAGTGGTFAYARIEIDASTDTGVWFAVFEDGTVESAL
jgi:hypothetical protein